MQKGIGTIHTLVILALLILAGSVGYVYIQKNHDEILSKIKQRMEETVIQEIILEDGSHVSLASSDVLDGGFGLNKIFNCKLPEIDIINVSLEFKNEKIPLGLIGIPKKLNDNFPIIDNRINYGLEDQVKFLEWSPLQKLVHGFGVIDYSFVKSVNPQSRGSIGLDACYLEYKMQFFEIDKTTKSLKLRDAGTGLDLYGDLERFKKEIAPNCSPFGCG